MNNRRMVTWMLLSLSLFFAWSYVSTVLKKTHPEWFPKETPATQPVGDATPLATSGPASGAAASTSGPTTLVATTQSGAYRVVPATQPGSATIGHAGFDPKEQSSYPLGVHIVPRGAAIDAVTLNRFRLHVGKDDPYVYQQPYPGADNNPAAHALLTRGVSINDTPVDLGTADWNVSGEGAAATAWLELADAAGRPVLRIEKRFALKDKGHPSAGYEMSVGYRLINLGDQALKVAVLSNGPNVPNVENNRDMAEVVIGAAGEKRVTINHHSAAKHEVGKAAASVLDGQKNTSWVGFLSTYFGAIARPAPDAKGVAKDLADVTASGVIAPDATTGQPYTNLTFASSPVAVAPRGTSSLDYNVFFGPRLRRIFESEYYNNNDAPRKPFPLGFDEALVLTSGPCGYCTFIPLINGLVWLLTAFYGIFRDWGIAIICLVFLVRAVLHPITKKSQINMSKMSKLSPEIERLKLKYADDKEELNRQMMSFYKEHGGTQILGCLPMFLQMPIWIALWSSLQSTFELRHASFLWGYTWIKDLSQPDRMIAFSQPVSMWFIHFDAINLLPVLLGVVFFIQQQMTPKPPAMDAQQEQQQKMMKWMSLLFPLFLYSSPAGLNLYIMTSTTIGIIESKIVRDHIKKRDEAEAAGKVIVDAGSKKKGRPGPERKPEPRKGGLMGWLSQLQQRAEDLRNQNRKDK